MALTSFPGGLYYPMNWIGAYLATASGTNNMTNLSAQNAATDKCAMIGRVYWADGATNTIDTSGSSAISFMTGTCTFANGATSVTVGIQDVSTTTGPTAEPDGVFDVNSAALVGGGGGIVTASWNNISMSGGAGSKSIAHGQLIAVVLDMTARGGADSIVVQGCQGNALAGSLPVTNVFDAGAWGAGTEQHANVLLTATDGTLGMLAGGGIFTSAGTNTYADSSNPDEVGNIFQVPFECKVDALWAVCGCTDTNSDAQIDLYSTPLGTPASMIGGAITILGEQLGSNGQVMQIFPIAETTLSANTDYVVACKATGSTNFRLAALGTVNSASYWDLLPGGQTTNRASRQNASGAFAETATTRMVIGVRISALHTSGGAGGSVFGADGGVII